jgi:hypothetical protein
MRPIWNRIFRRGIMSQFLVLKLVHLILIENFRILGVEEILCWCLVKGIQDRITIHNKLHIRLSYIIHSLQFRWASVTVGTICWVDGWSLIPSGFKQFFATPQRLDRTDQPQIPWIPGGYLPGGWEAATWSWPLTAMQSSSRIMEHYLHSPYVFVALCLRTILFSLQMGLQGEVEYCNKSMSKWAEAMTLLTFI